MSEEQQEYLNEHRDLASQGTGPQAALDERNSALLRLYDVYLLAVGHFHQASKGRSISVVWGSIYRLGCQSWRFASLVCLRRWHAGLVAHAQLAAAVDESIFVADCVRHGLLGINRSARQ